MSSEESESSDSDSDLDGLIGRVSRLAPSTGLDTLSDEISKMLTRVRREVEVGTGGRDGREGRGDGREIWGRDGRYGGRNGREGGTGGMEGGMGGEGGREGWEELISLLLCSVSLGPNISIH